MLSGTQGSWTRFRWSKDPNPNLHVVAGQPHQARVIVATDIAIGPWHHTSRSPSAQPAASPVAASARTWQPAGTSVSGIGSANERLEVVLERFELIDRFLQSYLAV